MSYRAALALGSNLGDRLATLRWAVMALGRIGTVASISSLYETDPVGGPPQGLYLNGIVVVLTELSPETLLAAMLEIEAEAGRERNVKWGPRTLDLDLIVVAGDDGAPLRIDTPSLTLPHPRAHQRRFVLEPLAEVWPDAPLGEATAETARRQVGDQEVWKVARDWQEAPPAWVSPALLAAQLALFLVFAGVTWLTRRPSGAVLEAVGVAVVLGGLGLGAWAVLSLGTAFTPFPEPRPGTALVDRGPYRWIRHPIYSAVVLTMVGAAATLASVIGLALAVLTGVFFWFKAGYEERRLRLLVAGYSAYAARVKGRLVPR